VEAMTEATEHLNQITVRVALAKHHLNESFNPLKC